MKKLSLITMLMLSVTLVACSKESDFKNAINAKISQQRECLNIRSDVRSAAGDVNDADYKKFQDKTKDSFVIGQRFGKDGKVEDYAPEYTKNRFAQLDALVGVGLLSKTSESLPIYSLWDKKPDGRYYTFAVYTLTDAGKATQAQVKPSAMAVMLSGDSGKRVFCYAKLQVDNIDNYTEGNTNGYQIAEVKYTYKYVDIADWANNSEVKTTFPEISKELENPNKVSTITLVKTKNGWSTDL